MMGRKNRIEGPQKLVERLKLAKDQAEARGFSFRTVKRTHVYDTLHSSQVMTHTLTRKLRKIDCTGKREP